MVPEQKSQIVPAKPLPPVAIEEPTTDINLREKLTAPMIFGQLTLASTPTQTTVGAAGSASALPANPTGYLKLMIGNTEVAIPYYAVS